MSAAKQVAAVTSSHSLSSIILSSSLPRILPPPSVAPLTLQHSLLSFSFTPSPSPPLTISQQQQQQQQGTSQVGELIPQLLSERIDRKAHHPHHALNLAMLQLLHAESPVKAVLAAVFAAAKAVQLAGWQAAEGRRAREERHQKGGKEGESEADSDGGGDSHFSVSGVGRRNASEGSDVLQGAESTREVQQDQQQQPGEMKALEMQAQRLMGFAMTHSEG